MRENGTLFSIRAEKVERNSQKVFFF